MQPRSLLFAVVLVLGGAGAASADDLAVCENERDPQRAIAACTRLADDLKAPGAKDAWIFINRGISYWQAGQSDAALRDYASAIRLDPADPTAYYNRARMLNGLAEYDRALADVKQAIALKPDYAYAHNVLGTIYIEMGHHGDAVEPFARAVALDPKDEFHHNNLGVALTEVGRYEEALASLQAALDIDARYGNALLNRAVALACLGRRDEAKSAFDHLLRLYPDRAGIRNGIAWRLSKSDKPGYRGDEFPLEMAKRAVELDDIHAYRDTLAAAYANAGDFEQAVTEEQRAIDMATARNEMGFIEQYERRLALYRAGKVLVE